MKVDGHRRHHTAESARLKVGQRQAQHREELPPRIVEERRVVADVHVLVMVAMRRHHDSSIQLGPRCAHLTGARIARPGGATLFSRPLVTTAIPPTSTCAIPSGASDGRWYVDRSITRTGSNTTRSASAPTLTRPLLRIAGIRSSSRRAGITVILRRASIKVSVLASRTYRPSTCENVPVARGWPRPSRS